MPKVAFMQRIVLNLCITHNHLFFVMYFMMHTVENIR